MYVYEVDIKIQAELEQRYYIWLKEHVEQMLEVKGFLFAEIFKNEKILVRYMIDNESSYKNYINSEAKKMRASVPSEFVGQVEITRRDYEQI